MCKYCENVYTGNDFKPIIEGYIKGIIDGSYDVYLTKNKNPKINLDITLLNRSIVEEVIEINYCPICGKYLREES